MLLSSDSATWVAVGVAVQFAVGARPIDPFDRLHLSAGIAQIRSDDDATSFFERADEALYQAKEAGKGQFMAADGLG